MPAVTSVTVEKCVYNFLYSTGGPLNAAGSGVTYPPTLLLNGPECINKH